MNKTIKETKPKDKVVPVEKFQNDQMQDVYIMSNGTTTLSSKYKNEVWSINNKLQSQLNSLR